MSDLAMSPAALLHPIRTQDSESAFSLRLQCPACPAGARSPMSLSQPRCPECGYRIAEVNGIWSALPPDREASFRQFVHDYELVREKEGRGSSSSDYYLALPFRDLTGRNVWQWQIRARTFRYLEKRLLGEIGCAYPQGCDVLDVGAGNGWLSYRLARLGHRPVAVDLLHNDTDGLGAARHYFSQLASPFLRFKAEMDQLPFATAQFDVVIFNASLHYSADYRRTLGEALRCLRTPGHLIIADSPFYWHDESGEAMMQERRAVFERQFGFRSDSIESCEYFTPRVLNDLERELDLRWRIHKPWYGIKWALRPVKAQLMGRREPSKFYLLHARIGD
jgi:SAM-dependent methyltransferase